MGIRSVQISVGTTATSLHKVATHVGALGAEVTIKHTGTNSVFIGPSDVATSGANRGYELESGDVLPIDMTEGEELFGIVASGTETVDVLVTGE